MSIIKCRKCNKYREHEALNYCTNCYPTYLKLKKSLESPLIKCQCSDKCQVMIPSIGSNGQIRRYARGHNMTKETHVYRIKTNDDYYLIYKPYHIYSHISKYILEHRYIMHIYLSIKYNRIIYLPTKYDVHHKNGNGLDNRIENLELITKPKHAVITLTTQRVYIKRDTTNIFCNLCKYKTKINNRCDEQWYTDIDGYLCIVCYGMIRYLRKKLGLPTSGF